MHFVCLVSTVCACYRICVSRLSRRIGPKAAEGGRAPSTFLQLARWNATVAAIEQSERGGSLPPSLAFCPRVREHLKKKHHTEETAESAQPRSAHSSPHPPPRGGRVSHGSKEDARPGECSISSLFRLKVAL